MTYTFPKEFLWGGATAANQFAPARMIAGATQPMIIATTCWNASGSA